MMESKTDPYTGETFVPSRRNQVYASPRNKIRHNNERAAQKRAVKSAVDSILDSNWQILHRLLGVNDEVVVSRQELLRQQFRSTHITHSLNTPEGKAMCIYDVCYIPLPDGSVKIKRHG